MNWLQKNKVAGWQDWFSIPPEARAQHERSARQNALQNAMAVLRGIENDPQIENIIQQIRALMQQ